METYNHLRVVKKNSHELKKQDLDLHQLLENDEADKEEWYLQSAYLGSLRKSLEFEDCQGLIEYFWEIEHCLHELPALHSFLASFQSQISANLLRVLWELSQSSKPSELCLKRCLSALRLSVEDEIAHVQSEMDELFTDKKNSEH